MTINAEVQALRHFLDIAKKASGEGDSYLITAAILQVGADIERKLGDIEIELQKIWAEMPSE